MSKKQSGLGRDLYSLFDDNLIDDKKDAGLTLKISDIEPRADQPRKQFEREALEALADSISNYGVLQPIIVHENPAYPGKYEIIAGERRWRAAKMAGLSDIPAVVLTGDELKLAQVSLIENLQREDLNPVEEAQAIRALMDECGLTQEAVAAQLGRSRPAVANLLRILTLPKEILAFVTQGTLSAGHARVLAGVEGRARQLALCKQAIEQGWSVRELERAAQREESKPKRPVELPLELSTLEDTLRESLGLRATISGTLKKGRIVLQYGSADELEAFYEAIERLHSR